MTRLDDDDVNIEYFELSERARHDIESENYTDNAISMGRKFCKIRIPIIFCHPLLPSCSVGLFLSDYELLMIYCLTYDCSLFLEIFHY